VEDALRAERDELLRLVDGKVLITQEENENNKTLAAEVAERTKERNAQMERAGALKRVLFVANAEVATSLRERNDAIEAAKVCEDREAKFRAEVARLKEALEKYGFHDFECVMEDGGDTCSCGLLDAARER
jgi:Tfp pilus assembly protein PilP